MMLMSKEIRLGLILLGANNRVTRIRITLQPVIFVILLIRHAPNTDNPEFAAAAKTYSKLFEVVGTLLQDHLTKLNCF